MIEAGGHQPLHDQIGVVGSGGTEVSLHVVSFAHTKDNVSIRLYVVQKLAGQNIELNFIFQFQLSKCFVKALLV